MKRNPIYYRLFTSFGSLTLISPEFVELHQLMISTPRQVFDFQLGGLSNVVRVAWTGNGSDWVEMSDGAIAAAFSLVLLHWLKQRELEISR
jgi:hypothetical protein